MENRRTGDENTLTQQPTLHSQPTQPSVIGCGTTKDSAFVRLTVSVTYTGGATFEIRIPKTQLQQRLRDGQSLQDIADELIYDMDYSDETDRDESDQDLTIQSVEVETE